MTLVWELEKLILLNTFLKWKGQRMAGGDIEIILLEYKQTLLSFTLPSVVFLDFILIN